jgi:hypothetical protein
VFEPAGEIPSEVEGAPKDPEDVYCAVLPQGVRTRNRFSTALLRTFAANLANDDYEIVIAQIFSAVRREIIARQRWVSIFVPCNQLTLPG